MSTGTQPKPSRSQLAECIEELTVLDQAYPGEKAASSEFSNRLGRIVKRASPPLVAAALADYLESHPEEFVA